MMEDRYDGIPRPSLPRYPSAQDTSAVWTNCQGIYKDHGDTKYVGEWHNNKRNGQGSCWYPDGCKYVGQF